MPLITRQRLALDRLFPSQHTQALTDPQLDRLAQLWTAAARRRVRAARRQAVRVGSPVWRFRNLGFHCPAKTGRALRAGGFLGVLSYEGEHATRRCSYA